MEAERKRKYSQIALCDEENNLRRIETEEKVTNLAVEHGVSPSDIVISRTGLLDEQHGDKSKTRVTTVEKTEFEKQLYKWFVEQISAGHHVSGPLLQQKAIYYNEKLNGWSDFKASNGWLKRFRQRHGILPHLIQKEKLSNDKFASCTFRKELIKLIQNNEYEQDDVYNVAEAGLFWNSLPQKTLPGQERQVPEHKNSKDRVTVLLCANATGTHKIQLLLIGESQNPCCLKGSKNLEVTYQGQKSASVNEEIFINWYTNFFLTSIKNKKTGRDAKFLLLLDNAPYHPSAETLNAIDNACRVIHLPQNESASIQPMDQGVVDKMKKECKKNLLSELLLEMDEGKTDIVNILKNWNIFKCCDLVSKSWESINETTIKKSWNSLLHLDDRIKSYERVNDYLYEITTLLNRIPDFSNYSVQETDEWLREDDSNQGRRNNEDTIAGHGENAVKVERADGEENREELE